MYIVVNTGGSTVGEKLGVKVNIGTTILGIMYTVVLAFAESIERNRTIEIGGKLNKKYLILWAHYIILNALLPVHVFFYLYIYSCIF